jgi:hypothetical protein
MILKFILLSIATLYLMTRKWNLYYAIPIKLWLISTYIVYVLSTFIVFNVFKDYYDLQPNIANIRLDLYTCFISSFFLFNSIFKKTNYSKINFPHLPNFQTFKWFTFIILILYILLGGIDARNLYGNEIDSSSNFYWIRGFFDILYITTFILAFRKTSYLSIIYILFVVLVMILGGHRAYIVMFALIIISAYSIKGNFKFKKSILPIIFITLSLYFITKNRFVESSLPMEYLLFERAYEPTIDRVIEYDEIYSRKFYFENFERIITIPIPAFLLPSKKNNDDKDEVLENYYGFQISEKSHWPLPGLVDSFRRFGYVGVVLFTFIMNYFLFFILKRIKNDSYKVLLYPFIIAFSFRLFSFSVLGTIAFFLYNLVKMYLILMLFQTIQLTLIKNNEKNSFNL